MSEILNSFSLNGICAALAESIGIERPAQSNPANPQLVDLVKHSTKNGKVDRIFMYNPDAIAMWVYRKYTYLFGDVVKNTSLPLPLCSVMPSVTPVCFGTMYTGAMPEVHGIQSYTKPVISIDTIFDSMIRAGKRCAILGDPKCSLCNIYLERDMDYFPIESVDGINQKAMELIEKDEHDFIVCYNGNYDATMHKTGPESTESIDALKGNIAAFDMLAEQIRKKWAGHDTLLGFAMDHGCHEIDGGCGSHGLDMPEDLNIMHFYGVIPAAGK